MTPPTPAEILRSRVVEHLEEIQAQRDSFDRGTSRLGRAGWVEAWARRGSADQADIKGSVERAYEQIVNDLQALFDNVERDATTAGIVPARDDSVSSAAWWAEADALGMSTDGANRAHQPGRWRRLAVYGHLDHDGADALADLCNTRNLLQHGYAQRSDDRAEEVWALMHALRGQLSDVIASLMAFRDETVDALER